MSRSHEDVVVPAGATLLCTIPSGDGNLFLYPQPEVSVSNMTYFSVRAHYANGNNYGLSARLQQWAMEQIEMYVLSHRRKVSLRTAILKDDGCLAYPYSIVGYFINLK